MGEHRGSVRECKGIVTNSNNQRRASSYSHDHKGQHPKRGEAYSIRFYTPWVHAQHPVAVQVSTNQRNGNH